MENLASINLVIFVYDMTMPLFDFYKVIASTENILPRKGNNTFIIILSTTLIKNIQLIYIHRYYNLSKRRLWMET